MLSVKIVMYSTLLSLPNQNAVDTNAVHDVMVFQCTISIILISMFVT